MLTFPQSPEARQKEEEARKAKVEFRRVLEMSPRQLSKHIEAKEAERQAQIDREWAMEPDELAAYLRTLFPKWPTEEIAEMVKDRMIAKTQIRQRPELPNSYTLTETELAEIEVWVKKYCQFQQ